VSIGVPPSEFWRLSFLDWRALMRAGETPITVREAQALARLYPDETP
jgi:hypothetical protein